MNVRFKDYFSWHFESPFKTVHKVRSIFKPHRLKWFFVCPIGMNWIGPPGYKTGIAKVFDVWAKPEYVKDKFNSPRFSSPPIFRVILFKWIEFGFWIIPPKELEQFDYIYWETIYDYLYYSRDLNKAIENNRWETLDEDKEGKKVYYDATVGLLNPYDKF